KRIPDAFSRKHHKLRHQCSQTGLLARKRLDDPGELRKEKVQDRPRRELGHATTTGRLQLVTDVEWALVEGFNELEVRSHEKRSHDAVDELGMGAGDVGVDPRDDVAGQHVQALPERLALAAVAAGLGKDLIVYEDRHALFCGDLAGAILRA